MHKGKIPTPDGWESDSQFTADNVRKCAEENTAHVVYYRTGDDVELRLADGRTYVPAKVVGHYQTGGGTVYWVEVFGKRTRRFASRLRRPQLKKIPDSAKIAFENEMERCPRHGPGCTNV